MHTCLHFSRRPKGPPAAACALTSFASTFLLPRCIYTSLTVTLRSSHGISANICGLYSGSVRKGSTYESRDWFQGARQAIPDRHEQPFDLTTPIEKKDGVIRQVFGRGPSVLDSPHLFVKPAKQLPKKKSPAAALAQYLDLKDDQEKATHWNSLKQKASSKSLPMILIHYIHTSSIPQVEWDISDRIYRNSALEYLSSRNFTIHDVVHWASIVLGDTSSQIIDRFLSIQSERPTFLLLEVIRKDIQHVEALKRILRYAWEHLLDTCRPVLNRDGRSITKLMPENAFTLMVNRLLLQSRQIWPAANVSVARMVPQYIGTLIAQKPPESGLLDDELYTRLCKINNDVLPLLALPASIEPIKSMVYSWTAQKVLLELAGQCNPTLLLDKDSYRAVIQVHAVLKKTGQESRTTNLGRRSWPPWRVEQDGMDAQRSFEDDLSRVTTAVMRSMEAGYREEVYDQALKVLGGHDLDWTPTVQTRKLVKWRAGMTADDMRLANLNPKLWAARVESTRDVREAWRAFVAYQDTGGSPSQTVYLSMFTKLEFEQRRQAKATTLDMTPGDGKEVFPVPDDNMSASYRSQTQPPTLDVLYQQMLAAGLRPAGTCLLFLVRHARTPTEGLRYLRDAGLNPATLGYLSGGTESSAPFSRPSAGDLKGLDVRTLDAFIYLICRFAPRAILASPEMAATYKLNPIVADRKEAKAGSSMPAEDLESKWCIQEIHRSSYIRLHDPLRHARRLLLDEQPVFRPVWYKLFEGLARRDVVVSLKHIGGPKNDEKAWEAMVVVLRMFHRLNLELDPYGFMLICRCFAKFAEAAFHSPEKHQDTLAEGARLVKDLFANLSKSKAAPHWIPKLLHSIKSVHLHNYVRCMGLVGDCAEVVSVLRWMIDNRFELEMHDLQDRNAAKMLTRTLVAARISCYGTEYEQKAIDLVKQNEAWQWPNDMAVAQYAKMEGVEEPGDGNEDDEDKYDKDGDDEDGGGDDKGNEAESRGRKEQQQRW